MKRTEAERLEAALAAKQAARGLRKDMKEKLSRSASSIHALFPHAVKLTKRTRISSADDSLNRIQIRQWLTDRNMSVYMVNGDEADVYWDKNWKEFRFKSKESAMEFTLHFF